MKKDHSIYYFYSSIFGIHANQEVLTDWERALIKDRLEALKKYELCAVATRKQVYQIGQIWKKFKLKQKLKKVEI
jgi:hypothetical protein